jgi:excinuclease ABC subunit B
VGINLLREGLDLPEVSLVCILDADKEGFLRNETSLVQTAGRAARHVHGECVLFCDVVTDSIRRLVEESDRRRVIQQAYNEAHGITPQSVSRGDQSTLRLYTPDDEQEETDDDFGVLMAGEGDDEPDVAAAIARLEKEMREAASRLDFEVAAVLRDKINLLKNDKRRMR